ncbi:MAG: MtrB/PioB family decaheme-associated outer membrane protein [Rhodospirillaceae bacterium]|nr:MtrB/PioB family decaheme-associated outer membrane protein [Rhodospirillaceae bacterium]
MRRGRYFWLGVSALMISGAPVRAQDDSFDLGATPALQAPPPLFVNSVEAGVGYQSLDSFYFGRYGGVTDKVFFPLLNGYLQGGSAWNAANPRTWSATIDLYGLDMLSLSARYGAPGRWRADIAYDMFTRSYTESARTPFLGAGGRALTLPANWITGVSSNRFAPLNQSAAPLNLAIDWKTAGGDVVWTPYAGYEVRLQFNHRNRQGTRAQSLPFGQEGNFSVGVFFPQPVDYDSERLNASLAYTGNRLQWMASYSLSVFTDKIDATIVPNLFSRSLGTPWPGGAFAGYPLATGQYSSPPDSSAHQFQLSGGYAFTPKTRLALAASYAVQNQNAPYLPYTINALLSAPEALPRASFGGSVYKTHLAANLTSRAWRNFDLSAGYTLDDRQNHAPLDFYNYVANDVQDQVSLVPGASRYIRGNLPHSFTSHQLKAEAGYRVRLRTRVSLSYSGDLKSRSYQAVATTNEHTVKAKILTNFDSGSAWLSYTFAARTGSLYNDALAWNLSHTAAYLSASPLNQSIEHPLMRKYNMANRRRQEVKGGGNVDLTETLVFDVAGGFSKDRYYDSALGLRGAKSISVDTDLSYVFQKRLTASVFYSFEREQFDTNGYLVGNGLLANPQQFWRTGNRDINHTAGVKLDWQAVPDKYKLGISYYLSDGASRVDVQSTPFIIYTVTAPLPDAREITHNLGLTNEYALRAGTAVRLGYTWQRHRNRDWQYDGLGLAPVAQILGSGIIPPRYTAHVVWVSTRYEF